MKNVSLILNIFEFFGGKFMERTILCEKGLKYPTRRLGTQTPRGGVYGVDSYYSVD